MHADTVFVYVCMYARSATSHISWCARLRAALESQRQPPSKELATRLRRIAGTILFTQPERADVTYTTN